MYLPFVISPFLIQCFVCATVSMNVLSNGCAYGFPAVLLPQLKLPDSLIPLTKAQESWIASIITIAMLVGNLSMPLILDKLGRKKAHFLINIPAVVGWLLIIFANNVQIILLARLMHGLSFGQMVPLRAVVIGEYSSPKNRGAFLTTTTVAQTLGMFLVHLIGSLIHWKMTALICVSFTLISFIMTFFLPESPSWLASKGKYDECKQHFHKLRGDQEEAELNELIQARMEHNATKTVINFKNSVEIVRKVEFYKPILLFLHVTLLVYVAGGMNLAVYGVAIVGLIMGPGVDANFWLVEIDILRIITNILAVYFMKMCLRRTVAFSTGVLCLIAHVAVVAHVIMIKQGITLFDYIWIPALLLNLQCFAVSAGVLPIMCVIAGEIFPLAYRSIGISFGTAIATLFHFLILKTFPYLTSSVGIEGVYGIYGSVILYCLIVMWFLMPETKGRTLQQIEDNLKGVDRSSKNGCNTKTSAPTDKF
ncbi:unnamed protein product [Pieris macdunnoughi]|uniref:Major facilitator superfamily (MFS) profile domain-containing protein n=1 Tax=Pieris macdunnoughi TaxID=345717 RepID=A0A821TZ95_9NEOP|nr:unnamed protein product [Pieris macdunnoughi]